MGDNFKVILEAMIDQSSLTNAQKQVAKQKLKIGADISVEDFAKSKNAIEKQMVDLAKGIKTILGDAISDKQATQWANQYYKQMVDGAKQAEKQLAKEAAQRQKNIELAQKQEAANRKAALDYTKDASRKLSSAVSKYSYGDSKEANKMIKQMNRGVSNFGNLEDIEGDAKRLDAIIDGIIANLKRSHTETLKAINAEIKAEQEKAKIISDFNKEQDKNIPNGVDDLIKRREQEAKSYASSLKAQMEQLSKIDLLANGGVKNDYSTQIAKIQGDFKGLGDIGKGGDVHVNALNKALQELRTELSKPIGEQNFDVIENANNRIQSELIESSNTFEQLKASLKGYATEQQRLTLANTIEAWNQKNTAATKAVLEQNNKYITSLRELDVAMDRVSFDNIKNGFKQAENSMRGLGKLGASFRNQMKQAAQSFTTWLSASTAVMTVISKTREAMTELKEVNTLLTEISKARDTLTESQLDGIGDRSFETASQFGKKATDYLSGVQEMARAGYDNVEAMGALSVKAQGAGAMTADVANSFIVATDKAYKLNGSLTELTEVMDGINYITNHNAVNMTELSEGFSVVASTASSFGVEANELSAALGTMAASTQQSGSEVARAFRAILLNIRQVSDEEEGIDAEGLTKYEEACKALGVSLKQTVNGVQELRDPMEVLKELSVEYNKLSDTDIKKVNLLNSVGGKLRSTQLDALLRGWSDYEKMLGQFADGSGSMAKEAEKTANSWEGSMNRLSNTWTDTIGNIANSDGVIGLIKSLDWVLDKINKLTGALGSLGSIGLIGGLVAGAKNFGRPKMFGLKLLF